MTAYVTADLLRRAILALGAWQELVVTQRAVHVWSVLPIKLRGAAAGTAIAYTESNDRDFLDRFLRLRPDDHEYPYFDPFSHEWRPAGYHHSNMATFRKNTFQRSWDACDWDGERLTLSDHYVRVMTDKVLAKAGRVNRIPALPCAVWFFKRPTAEWPDDEELTDGVPADAGGLTQLFKKKFNFTNDEWVAMFDDDPDLLPNYASSLSVTP